VIGIALSRRMFRGEAADELLFLDLSILGAGFDLRSDGWWVFVSHGLTLQNSTAEELGHWTVKGQAPIAGLAQAAIPSAFEQAADDAAEQLEVAFEQPPALARLLQARGVELGAYPRTVAAARAARVAPVAPPHPPRSSWVAYLDAGIGFAASTASTNSMVLPSGRKPPFLTSDSGPIHQLLPALRVGLSSDWGLVQLAVSTRGSSWVDDPTPATMTTVGVDVAPVLRLGDLVELAAGGGAHWVLTEDVTGQSDSRIAPALFGMLRLVHDVGRARLRYGIELRRTFGETAPMVSADTGQVRSWRTYELGNSLSLFFGFELPVGRR